MMHWDVYHRAIGAEAFGALWSDLAVNPVLLVLGAGFDPRMTRVLEAIVEVAKAPVDVLRVRLGEESSDPDMRNLADEHAERIALLVASAGGEVVELTWPDVEARRTAGLLVSRAFHEKGYLERYDQIVVDISGLPRSVYFPLLRGLLQEGTGEWDGDLHVATVDSHEVDRALLQEGAESVAALGGFAGPSDVASWAATVWVPVLGERMGEQLLALHESIEPDEVVPVLPFPAANPRRADELLLEHRDLLAGRFAVEPRNYLYASESNPFDLYRAILDLYDRYQPSLRPLGAAKFVLSTHSSKLLSIGVLLAAFELGLQVMHVGPSRHGLVAGSDAEALSRHGEVCNLWLTGEPYR